MSRQGKMPDVRGMYRFLMDRNTDWRPKALLALSVVYLVWPLDLVPDLVPVLGWLDDVGLGTLALWYVSQAAKQHGQLEDRAEGAGQRS